MNYRTIAVKAAAATIIIAAAAFLFLPIHDSGAELVEIKDGTAGKAAARQIAQRTGAYIHAPFFISYTVCSYVYGSAKPGCYSFHHASIFFMMKALCRGRTAVFSVTDGMTVTAVADALARLYHAAPGESSFAKMKADKNRYEGKFFPATYPVLTKRPEDLISAMLKKYNTIEKELNISRDDLIIASIIQREAKYPVDFRRCAGVIRNRLNADLPLECDSTLQYILGSQRLTKDLLESSSPYNTYKRKGLPPSPICSPGADALNAAQRPEEHNYLFFVAKKDGRLYFSKNKHEHYRAVEYYMLGRPNGFRPEKQ